MHCEDPVCAKVCPADAITKDEFGIVHSANTARCIACSNCVQACPFGVPKKVEPIDLMMKCNMCYDRTSAGKKPMCATVCPSGALFFGTREQISRKPSEQLAGQHVSIWPATGQNQSQHHDAQRRHGTRGGQRMNPNQRSPGEVRARSRFSHRTRRGGTRIASRIHQISLSGLRRHGGGQRLGGGERPALSAAPDSRRSLRLQGLGGSARAARIRLRCRDRRRRSF